MRSPAACLLVAILLFAAGCTSSHPRSVPRSTPATPTQSPSPGRSASSSPLASCPPARRFDSLSVFARLAGAPDDLAAVGDGSMWVSDPDHGIVWHLDRSGRIVQRFSDAEAPEGMVVLPGGTIALAEQRTNRVVVFHPPSIARTTLYQLPSAGSATGVDGIGFDPASKQILIPDSPHGTLYGLPPSGGRAKLVARGLGRDVGVASGANGEAYVALEGSPGLLRIASTGAIRAIGDLTQADDVASAGDLLYVTLIDAGQVVAVDPASGAHRVLVNGSGRAAAQGLAMLPDGRLALSDSATGVVATFGACA